ncbi:MAG TPA: ParB/RepB/Spo0J family partition protein, partial [Planctomycetaceae bacterium]|nr:ParB/RepB/Spo0J family partition protein [Planctomycetaceae bacterium]
MPNAEAMTYKLQQVPVGDIRPGPNVRQAVDPSELAWLADSLKVRQQQPLLVDADHVLIDGYRRWLAAQRAELKWLWAIVTNRPLSKAERTEAQLVMDLHRQDFTDAEKVAACEALLAADPSLDQKRLAEKLQVDPATVSRWLSVSADRVIPEVRAAFDEGRIKLMLAHAISQAPPEAQAELLQLALGG